MNKLLPVDLSCKIIEEIGQRNLASICVLSPGGVNHWKKRGMPRYRADYLRLRFPKLEAWKDIPKDF